MKIAIGYRWFPTAAGYHLERALDQLHHKVQYVGLSSEQRSGYGETTSVAKILDNLSDKPELFLWVDPAGRYFPHDIETLLFPTACYLIDVHLGHWRKETAKFFDVVFLAQKDFVDEYKQAVGHDQVYWLPLGAASDVHFDHKVERIYDVGFVGNLIREHQTSGRGRRLEALSKSFKTNDFSQSFTPAEVGKIYSQSKIVFNNSISGDVTMRLFEGTACGALMLTNETQNGIDELFNVGEEVVTFSDDKDLFDKVKFYLEHPEQRQQIAQAGQKRTLENHLYTSRCQSLFSAITAPGFRQLAPMRTATSQERMKVRCKVYTHLYMLDAIFDEARAAKLNPFQRLTLAAPALVRRILR